LNPLKQYNIGFVGLPNGKHTYSFELADEFFACFEGSEIVHGQVQVEMSLEKGNSMLVFDFSFNGSVQVSCDRCLENYLQPLQGSRRLYVKFGEAYSEQTDEITIIPATESHFDVSQYLYEYLHLLLPVRKVHADSPAGTQGCDPVQVQKLEEYLLKNKKNKAGDDDQGPWSVLKSLKF
jgi:uncharacterized protein